MDSFSYECGVIDCFNEMVQAGLKPLALSHPCDTKEKRDSFLPFCREICAHYHTFFFCEDDPFLTDLFPLSMNRGKYNILFYRTEDTLQAYQKLKEKKKALVMAGQYEGNRRLEIALAYGSLLGYPKEGSFRLIEKNEEKEPN